MKRLLNAACVVMVSAIIPMYWISSTLLGSARVFPGWSQLFAIFPGLSGNCLRQAFYRWALPAVGTDACVCFGTIISHNSASIGDKAYVGPYCVIGDVVIERDALIGSQVSITNGSRQHGIERLDMPVREQPGVWPRITIGEDSWIGDRAVVMANVGKHCVVGAGSVVTKPVPDYAITVGVPARVIGWRNQSEVSNLITLNESNRQIQIEI